MARLVHGKAGDKFVWRITRLACSQFGV